MRLKHCNHLLLPEVTARPLTEVKGSPVPPLTDLMWIGLVGAILCQVLLLIVAGRHNRYVLDPDTIAYMRLAWYYATGQFHLAVSGYWGPLFSWLMVPWIGWVEHLVDVARIVMDLSAVVFVLGCVAIFRGLCLPPVALLMGTWLAALATVFWSMEYIGPDLLMNGLFGLALGQMLRVRWCTSRLTPWLTGGLCGMAYLAKAIALPVTVSCCVGIGVLWASSHRLPWRQVTRSVGLTLLGCALVAGPWIVVLSWKYRTPTFSTSAAINHAIAGPRDIERYHPVRLMFHQPEARRILAWEDPSAMPYHYWSPLENFSYAKHQLRLMYMNALRQLMVLRGFDVVGIGLFALVSGVLLPGSLCQRLQAEPWRWAIVLMVCLAGLLTVRRGFDVFGIGLFALVSGLLLPGSLRQRLQAEPWRWAVIPVICLAGWYLPVYAGDQRYYFLTYPLILTASMGFVLSLSHSLRRWQRGASYVGLLLVVSSFALPVLTKLPAALRGLEEPSVIAHGLAMKLQAAHVSGPFAGIGTKEGLYMAFFMNQPWYGEEQHPTLERLKAVPAMLYVIPRHADLLAQLDADPTLRNLDALLFASAEEAQHYPWRVYQRLAR
jgi:hypothetical protein